MFGCLDHFHKVQDSYSKAMFATFQLFTLISAEEKLEKTLPNIIEMYDEFCGEDTLIKTF